MTNIEQFLQMVKESDNIVFFGGAGVSTESGIPDFRSVDGLYNQKYEYPPETIFYTMSVYFMAAGIKKSRYTLVGALIATTAGTVASIILAGYM